MRNYFLIAISFLLMGITNILPIHGEDMATTLNNKGLKSEFEIKYKAWLSYCSQFKVKISSDISSRTECIEFKELVALGAPVVSFMMRKIEYNEGDWLILAVGRITKVKFNAIWIENDKKFIYPDFPDIKPGEDPWLYWWKKGRNQTPQRFERIYQEWIGLKKQGKEKEAKEKYQSIIRIGIDALPLIIDKIEDGDTELISAFSELTSVEIVEGTTIVGYKKSVKEDAKPSECLEWWVKNKQQWLLPPDKNEMDDLTKRLEKLTPQEYRRLKVITGQDFGNPKDKENRKKWHKWWEEYRKTLESENNQKPEEPKKQPEDKPKDSGKTDDINDQPRDKDKPDDTKDQNKDK